MKKIVLSFLSISLIFISNNINALSTENLRNYDQEVMPISSLEPIKEDENIACTMDYNPVCGVDGVTYGNKCAAGKKEIAYEGECEKQKPCTREYMPICGVVDVQCIKAPCNPVFETFANKCLLENNKLAKKAYEGVCKERISGPSKIKLYTNIKAYGFSLFGDKKEKIPTPAHIKFYKNIAKDGNTLYGVKK